MNETKITNLNYVTDVNIVTGNIYEYDIKSAYLSILRVNTDTLPLDDEDREFVKHGEEFEKIERLIYVGNMIKKYDWLSDYLNDWLRFLLHEFRRLNLVEDLNVISIKKDAIFTTKKCDVLCISGINFALKNKYNIFIKTTFNNKRVELYSDYKGDNYAIKGINDKEVVKSKDFFDTVFKGLVTIMLLSDSSTMIDKLKLFEKNFLGVLYNINVYYIDGYISLIDGYKTNRKLDSKELINPNILYLDYIRPLVKTIINYII